MRLVGLVESVEHVCCRYRLRALEPHWRAAGHQLELRPIPRSAWGRWRWDEAIRQADGVILQRKLLPRWALWRLRRQARYLIYDFDDAMWLRDSYSRHGLQDSRRQRRFAATVAHCDAVVAGNDFLADAVRRWAPHTPVVVIPTCVEPSRYPQAAHAATGLLRLVWIGSRSTLQGLNRWRETLAAIGQAVPGTVLRLICDATLSIPSLTVEFVPWSEQTEAAALAECDIGISYLPEDDWSRGKCGLKLLQYQAAGLPIVVNPVGVQIQMVQPDVNGYLARSCDEWIAAVRRLAGQPDLRRRLGRAGRQQVEERYSVSTAAAAWMRLLHRLRLRQVG